jgi:hypothetical protein
LSGSDCHCVVVIKAAPAHVRLTHISPAAVNQHRFKVATDHIGKYNGGFDIRGLNSSMCLLATIQK